MADQSKAAPTGTPNVPGRIVDGMRKAIANPKDHPRAFIRLTASGGTHGEKYEFEYMIDGTGNITSRMRDELKGRDCRGRPDADKQADPKRFASLAEAIRIDSLMGTERAAGGFPPDSVVGRLEISDGEQSVSFAFLADDSQAARAGFRTSESLLRAVDVVYQAAAAHLNEKDVRP